MLIAQCNDAFVIGMVLSELDDLVPIHIVNLPLMGLGRFQCLLRMSTPIVWRNRGFDRISTTQTLPGNRIQVDGLRRKRNRVAGWYLTFPFSPTAKTGTMLA